MLVCSPAFAVQSAYDAHTSVEIIPQTNTVSPSEDFWVAFEFTMDEHWHIYWRNPGDAGLAPDIQWQLPDGFVVKETLWPYPERIDISPLTNYGYEGKVVLLVKITSPENSPIDPNVSINAKVQWLACELECVPGRADLSLNLIWKEGEALLNDDFTQVYASVVNQIPVVSEEWDFSAFQSSDYFHIELSSLSEGAVDLNNVQFFAYDSNLIDHAAKQILKRKKDAYVLTVRKLDDTPAGEIEGVIVSTSGWIQDLHYHALLIKEPVVQKKITLAVNNEAKGESSIALILLFAFVGGVILNLMPCVLPVLSIKVLHLLTHREAKRATLILHGSAFTAGVVITFLALGFLLQILKSTGAQIGWGFQFQEPLFLIAMSLLFVVLGLNMFGFFEIGVKLTQVKLKGAGEFSYKGSFLNGILTTIVATPCTAPFMGTALGVAFFQAPAIAFLIFLLLGLGLAFPYLMITLIPSAVHLLPKPGRWMLVLKKIFAIMFFATALWLVWILVQQNKMQVISSTTQSLESNASGEIAWQEFSDELLMQSLAEGRAVFIDFTASWCLTCQVNEAIALTKKEVVEGFEKHNIVALKADWTNYSQEVTQALARYNRTSIPLYVLYTGDFDDEPIYLPEVLTPKVVLKYFKENL